MKKYYARIAKVLFSSIFILCAAMLSAQNISSMVQGKLLVRFKAAPLTLVERNAKQLSVLNEPGKLNTGITAFDAVAKQFKATRLKRVFPYAGRMEAKQKKYGLDRWYVVEIDKSASVQAALASFKRVAELEYAQPAYIIKSIQPGAVKRITGGAKKPLGEGDSAVNDPYYGLQWHYHNTGQVGGYNGADINLPEAWKITAGRPDVIVDVVDEGVDYNHEDLAADMWVNKAEANGVPGVDDDNNGYVDDFYGYNFADNSGTISPGDHGTHTAGTIAAVNNNGIGVAGIAGGTGKGDGARVMSSEIFGANSADGAATAAAIVYGANNGAVISQNSWGYNEPGVYDQAVLDAIDYFIKEAGRDANGKQVGPMNGGVVIFAAGNSNLSDPYYPAYYSEAIAVGATTCYDNKASYSNFGDWVDISAPGGDILGNANQEVASTVTNNGYAYMAGTSMACPHVSGVAALIVSEFGKQGFTNQDLKNRLLASVSKFIAMNPSYNGLMGAGRLDAGKAVQPDQQTPPNAIKDLKGISNNQNSIDLSWTAPADADNENAQNYIVYYSTHSFDSTQKDTLSKAFITKAKAAGSAETFNLSGLLSSTNYYVAVTSKDLWGNESSLSNIGKVKTMDGAVVSVPSSTIQINISVATNPLQTKTFKLSNKGQGALDWNGTVVPVSSSWAKPDGYNDTLRYVDVDYNWSYVGDDEAVPFSAATRFDVKGKTFSLTHVANYIQTQGIDKPIWVYIYKGGADPSKGQLLLKQQAAQAAEWGDLQITKLNGIYSFKPGEWFWIVYEYDGEYGYAQGYEYGADSALNNYFLASSNKGSSWSTITSLYQPLRYFMYALSNEGDFGGFVTLQPNSGSLAGKTSATIAVNANASTVRNGTYNFNIQVNSNDLNDPSVYVPLVVKVAGQKASLTSKEGILDCKTVFIGKTGDASVMLYNSGLSKLYNLSFKTTNNVFTQVSLPDTLYPGDSGVFTIRFTPVAAGLQQGNITIGSNGGSLKLSALGTGAEPPALSLSGVPVQIVAKTDSTGSNSFTISNKEGKYPLSYSFPEIAAINRATVKGLFAQGTEPYGAYTWIDSWEPGGPVYHWDDISTTGMDVTKQLDADLKNAKLFNLGFPFIVYGDTINQVYVTGMGMLTFSYPGAMNIISSQLPIPGDGINGGIAPLWLHTFYPYITGNMKVFVKYEPGKFIVQYNDVEQFSGGFFGGGSFSYGKATYQVVLFSDGKVEINYKDVSNALWVSSAIIGIENKEETKGFNVTDWQNSNPWYPSDNTTLWFVPYTKQFITSVKPLNGAVAPGDSVKVSVTASAKGLVDSSYNNTLALTTNDPANENVNIPVTLTVTGVQGMLLKTDTLPFGNVYKNGKAAQDAVLLNTGTKPVKLLSVAFDDGAFTSNITPAEVPAYSELRIPVSFAPLAEKAYTGTLTVTTDNATQPIFKVALNGNSTAAPSLQYEFTGGQSKTLNIHDSAAASVKLTNNGDADLTVMLERPQWLLLKDVPQGIGNGLNAAKTYSIHKTMDSAQAAYDWVELAQGLGTGTTADFYGPAYDVIKLPFAFPYYGKTYSSLYLNFYGDIYVKKPEDILQVVAPTIPSPLEPNGMIATADFPLYRNYNWDIGGYDGEIYYYADSEKLVIEFYKVGFNAFLSSGLINYEVVLYKDGRIKNLYKEGEFSNNYTHNMVIGIENEDGTDGTLAYNHTLFWKDKGAIEFVPSAPVTLHKGESVTIPATWTTTSLTDGVYNDKLLIVTNDPVNPSINIPLQLTVNGIAKLGTPDSVQYGKVTAYYDSANAAYTSYSQPVVIKNSGSKIITINNLSFSNSKYLSLKEQYDIVYPLVLYPGEQYAYHVLFTPDNTVKTLHEQLQVDADQEQSSSIDIKASVALAPAITIDSSIFNITMQQGDSLTRYVKVQNLKGKGDLDYNATLFYRRPGISYNSVSTPTPLSDSGKHKMGIMGGGSNPIGTLGTDEFTDSLLNFEESRTINYMGRPDDNVQSVFAVHFTAGPKGFNLSHASTLYRTDALENTSIKFRIKLGTNINTATTVLEQTVPVVADTSGRYLVQKLDSSILLYPDEDFWVEWEYALGMRYPQGIQFVPNAEVPADGQYSKMVGEETYTKEYYAVKYYIGAYESVDSTKGWLELAPANDTITKGKSGRLALHINGPAVPPVTQSVDVLIHNNDPAKETQKITVNVRIDQAPYLTAHDTLTVNEGDSLFYAIPEKDDEGSVITDALADTSSEASIINADTANYFVYKPGYSDSGIHTFTITLADAFNNKRTDSLTVYVANTNRPPVSAGLNDTTIYVDGAPLKLGLSTVFSDPDNDALQYHYLGNAAGKANVYLDSLTGELNVVSKDTGTVALSFEAVDAFNASVKDTLIVHIKKNTAPVAAAIPVQVIEVGAAAKTLNLDTWFTDADGNSLNYTVSIDSAALADVSVNGSTLSLTGKVPGNAVVTVKANDGNGGIITTSFLLTVLNNRGNIVDDYHITIGPNPFHSKTTIRFQLGTSKHVRIEVLGMTGRLNGVIFDGTKPSGINTISADLTNLAAGNYLIKFVIDGKQGVIQAAKL